MHYAFTVSSFKLLAPGLEPRNFSELNLFHFLGHMIQSGALIPHSELLLPHCFKFRRSSVCVCVFGFAIAGSRSAFGTSHGRSQT